jgi:undecaprenyl-diphosphatase
MILAGYLLGIPESLFLKSFEVIIQLGAILAVVLVYRKKICRDFKLMLKVLIAFIPTAVIGLTFYSFVKKYLLTSPLVVVVALLIGGILIVLIERHKEKNTNFTQEETIEGEKVEELTDTSISIKQALYIGLFQSVAIIPGVSRSAATIIGGELLGLKRRVIVEFSFLLAIPVMCAAAVLDVYKYHSVFTSENLPILGVGFVTAFVVALIAIKSFLAYIQRHSFAVFGVYRIVLAFVFLGILYVL